MLPIHLAARYGEMEVVRFLLECDPSTVSVKNKVSWPELILFRIWSVSLLALVLFLTSDHFNLFLVSSPQQYGSLLIHLAASHGDVEVVRVLLECDASTVSVKDEVSFLSWNCLKGDLPLSLVLLCRLFLISDDVIVFHVSSSFQKDRLPIHNAAWNGHVQVVRLLLECNPSTVSVQDEVSWPELILFWMWAVCLVGILTSCISHIWSYHSLSRCFLVTEWWPSHPPCCPLW